VRPWSLQHRDGAQATLELRPRVTMSDPESLCEAVAMGLGVGLVGMPHALPLLQSGALVRLLPRWYRDAGAVSLYFSGQKLLPAKTRAFVDFLVAAFREQDLAKRMRADLGPV
jgi:DNA-binding transcriptional LysR family regulator